MKLKIFQSLIGASLYSFGGEIPVKILLPNGDMVGVGDVLLKSDPKFAVNPVVCLVPENRTKGENLDECF